MAKAIEIFRNYCQDLLELTEIRDGIDPDELFSTIIHGDKYIHYETGYREKIDELVDYLLKNRQDVSDLYDRSYLLRTISDFLFELKFSDISNKTRLIDQFFNSSNGLFKEITLFTVTRLIVNLNLESDFSLGNVKFIPYSIEAHKHIYTDAGVSNGNLDRFLHQEKDEDVGCIAKVDVFAGDRNKAIELSDYLVEEALDILRLYLGRAGFGTIGSLESPQMFATACNLKTKDMFSTIENKDIKYPISLNLSRLENFRDNYGLTNIDNILRSENRSDMETNLIVSIRFLSKILKNINDPENISRIFISAEALLIDNEEKAQNLAQRLTVINYSSEKERNDLYNLVMDMYLERNKLIHEGLTNNGLPNYDGKEFSRLFSEMRNCVSNVAKKIDKYKKLSDWVYLVQNENFEAVRVSKVKR